MNNKYELTTKEQVLKMLGAKDFRSLTSDQIVSFVSNLPNMDPEVAKAAINQFPNFKESSIHILDQLNSLCEKAMTTDNNAIAIYKQILESLEKALQKPFITKSSKNEIIDKMIEIGQHIESIESKKLAHKRGIVAIFATAGTIATGILAAVLGVSSHKKD